MTTDGNYDTMLYGEKKMGNNIMKCYICDNLLKDSEIKFNHEGYIEPCSACLESIQDLIYGDEEELIADEDIDVLDLEFDHLG